MEIIDADDRNEIRRSIVVLASPAWQADAVVELRALGTEKGTVSGCFDGAHIDALIEAAYELSGNAEGVYLTLNAVKADCLARAANRVKPYAKSTTTDSEIVRRNWLLIDVDAKKPAGVSASEDEHNAALAATARIRDMLTEKGWPLPIYADSGNGGHLLYRIDLPADDGGLLQRVLSAIEGVDSTVHNAARISKLYGTLACKGDSIAHRPHRLARMIDVPDSLEIVTREQLESLAGASPQPAACDAAIEAHATAIDRPRQVAVIPGQFDPDKPGFDVPGWLGKHGLHEAGGKTKPWRDNVRGVDGTLYELSHCVHRPDEPDGGPHVIRYADGRITAGCKHSKCRGKGWKELLDKLEPGHEKAKQKAKKCDQYAFAFAGDEFFHSPEKEAFVASGNKTWPVKSETYKLVLRNRLYSLREMTIPDKDLKELTDTLTAKAIFGGPERQVYLRTAEYRGRYYVDLANDDGQAVEITADGWRVIDNPPVHFVRKDGMLPLPTPTHGGKISQLREFINVDDQSWPLVVMWLMAALRPGGPYPMLLISGEHGSAKSSFARVLRSLIDPSTVPHCKLPDSGRDLMITAKNSYVLSFDNLSHVPSGMSDLLCSLATKGGYRTRKGYTDDNEMLFSYARPQMLNGIADFATRGDLLSRSFSVSLPVVTKRKKEAEIYAAFEAAKPAIFGAMLTAAAYGLSRLEAVKAKRLELPRMADAIEWCIAAEGGLGFADGEFARAVWANENNATDVALAGSPVAGAVLRLMADRTEWQGTASELLAELNRVAGEPIKGAEGKPMLAHRLSKAMSEAAPDLRRRGVEVEIRTKTPKGIILTTLTEDTVAPPTSGGRLYDMVQSMKAQLVAAGCAPEQALEVAIAATSAAYPHRTVVGGMVFRSVGPLSAEDEAKLREHVPGWLAELRAIAREGVAKFVASLD